MKQHLMKLREQMTERPRLEVSNGMTVVREGDHVVQFSTDPCARFYAACFDGVPALVAEIEEGERQRTPGVLEKIVAELAAVATERDALARKVAELIARNSDEVAKRTNAEARARLAAIAVRRVLERVVGAR